MARGRRRPVPPPSRAPARPFARRVANPAEIDRLLGRQPWDSLVPHLLKAGASPEPTIDRLRGFAKLMLAWNRGVSNLISRNDEQRIVTRHIVESVEPAAWLKASGAEHWLDFGSGAGLPAIPLAIAGIGKRWTLAEARRMKTLFIRRAVSELELHEIESVIGRLDSISAESLPLASFDGFTSRATLALGPTLALAAKLLRPGGVAFLWKGSGREREMAEDPSWTQSWDFDGLLGIGDGRTTVGRFTRKS